ncbi:MAG: UDP-N-acetylmuramyl-tripeptide synthetase [Deltaproteobacteria bacterium]|nr:UDP-N-acetylmuramyl-tripeptide synthetase [Deltaproteobacteria bacterium]
MYSTCFPPPPDWSTRLRTLGVTGTNGKTSTTAFLAAALRTIARPVLRNTTVGAFLDDEPLDVPATYDGFLEGMRTCLDRGGTFAAIELTSEALALGFAKAWPCSIGVFTNLTRDHLDAHGSFEHYLASKAQLFVHLPAGGCAVLNGADPACPLLEEIIPPGVRVVRYGNAARMPADRALDLSITSVRTSWEGTSITLATSSALANLPEHLSLRLIGDLYAENAAAALAAAVLAGASPEDAARAISEMPAPPGRFEVIGKGPRAVVDYAHTPDALSRTLAAARAVCAGTLTVVFGAGGNRDQGKRAAMGQAARGADRIILTSDNPRCEDPAAIAAAIQQGLQGLQGVSVELDRAAAIREALSGASADDVVVIAGKGHEKDQDVGGVKRPFCDQDVARGVLRGLGVALS